MSPQPLSFVLLLFTVSACDSAPGTSSTPSNTSTMSEVSGGSTGDAAAESTPLMLRRLDKIPDAIDAKGPDAWGWRDANGENVFVVTYADSEGAESDYDSSRSRSMVITHDVLGSDGPVTRKRTVRDFVNDCPFDLHLLLEKDSLQVSDLDGDGLAEITFAYQFTCTSDVSPRSRKMLLLEDGEKYILRGHTGLNLPGMQMPSEFEVDPSVEKGPKVFRDHLIAAWGSSDSKSR